MTPVRRCTQRRTMHVSTFYRRGLVAATLLAGLGLLMATAPATGLAAPRPSAHPSARRLTIHRFTLANGLRVVVQPDHRAPVVALGIMVDIGARDETKGHSGLAHFFEHMMFQGSKHVAKMEHFTGLESVGADLNANTSDDRTYYYEVMPKNALELALWFESDRFEHLAINAKNVENQRQTVMEERRQRYDNRPYAASQLRLMQMVFTSWPLQHSVIGSMADLTKAPLAAFEQFWRRWYTPNNCVLVLVGDVDLAKARELVTQTMGRVTRRASPSHRLLKDRPRQGHTYGTYREPLGKMPAFHLAYRVPVRTHPDSAAIELLAEVLDGGDASRLSRKLEKETGLATRFWAGKYGRRTADVFHVAVEMSQSNAAAVAKAKRIIRDTLYDIALNGVTAEELERAKVGREARYVFEHLSFSARASMLARFETYYGDARGVNGAISRWRAVTGAQIQAATERWFGWQHEVELDVLPKGFAAPKKGGAMPRYVAKWQRQLTRRHAAIARRQATAAKAAERRTRRAAKREARKALAAQRKAARLAKEQARAEARGATARAQVAADTARRKAIEPRRARADGMPATTLPAAVTPGLAPPRGATTTSASEPPTTKASSSVGSDRKGDL